LVQHQGVWKGPSQNPQKRGGGGGVRKKKTRFEGKIIFLNFKETPASGGRKKGGWFELSIWFKEDAGKREETWVIFNCGVEGKALILERKRKDDGPTGGMEGKVPNCSAVAGREKKEKRRFWRECPGQEKEGRVLEPEGKKGKG